MTNKTYNKLWKSSIQDLTSLLEKETSDESDHLEQRDFKTEHQFIVQKIGRLYLSYIKVTNALTDCYETILQPQKRYLLRSLVDNCIGHVLELKQELVALEYTEFHFFDALLLELKMIPSDMDIKIPAYFHEKTCKEQEKLDLMQEYFRLLSLTHNNLDENIYFVFQQGEDKVTAIKKSASIIQSHVLAYQGRQAFLEAQKLHEIKESGRLQEYRKSLKISLSENDAALKIQKAWKWFSFHNNVRKAHMNSQPLVIEKTNNLHSRLKKLKKMRQDTIRKNEVEFLEVSRKVKEEIQTYHAPDAIEALQTEIRTYFEQYRQNHGEYPVFPTEEDGGSNVLLQKGLHSENEIIKMKNESTGKDKIIENKKKDVDKKEDGESIAYCQKASKYIPDLLELIAEYNRVWAEKEPVDIYDKYDEEMLKKEAILEMELSVRLHTDKIMREELSRLTEASEKDLGKKGKKHEKGGKKEKEKENDNRELVCLQTKGRHAVKKPMSFESLLEELIKEKVIINYPKFNLSDFIGDYNYVGYVKDWEYDPERDPMPCLLDIRRVINEFCVLPMGSPGIHSKGAYVKSILFAGPHGVGKKSLIYAICNETGATLMDLSAENINGKYPGKDGLDMLMHLISKVGRLAQPTVIYIKDAENYFWKKQAASSILAEAIRLKKELLKFIKGIGNEDRILICGTTVMPFDADVKGLCACYNKVICFLKPDHNCRRALWREMILNKQCIIGPQLNLSALCEASEGFTAPHLIYAIEKVLTDRRLAHQKKIPLFASEFIYFLSDFIPISPEENEEYKIWFAKLPLQKKRVKLLKGSCEMPEERKNKDKTSYQKQGR
ncbi:dynein regulatory complex protein 11-like [Stegodyphus dumicola]|uniref:dynein regulatory complex protein 11-like n=1 Tax=Stegodyphus dumicola TaxID=202533 RepID=UPI0015A873C3|nr:dynein regulatory complex protein 11-like [Stegodyphus dumicola]